MIPKILWQTAKSKNYINDGNNRQLLKSFIINNPNIDIMFMDDDECDIFIKSNFSQEIYDMYRSLPLGVMRADFWRVAVIYINGGIYSDTDVFCKKSIDGLINDKDLVLLTEPNTSDNVSNFFFAATPKHPVLKEIIDEMVGGFAISFNDDTHLFVQNFGMNPLQIVYKRLKLQLIPVEEHTNYIKHICNGSWRESMHKYLGKKNMNGMTFFTTFNEAGYKLYGKSWINTFKENVAAQYPNALALVYKHGFDLTDNHPQIKIIDYDEVIPHHAKWKQEFEEKSTFDQYIHKMTIRFSHKAMVIQHALKNIDTKYAFWVDGDVVFHKYQYDTFPKNVLGDNAMACQVEHAHNNHVESGILIFDMENPDTQKWRNEFEKNYSIDNVLGMSEPYDGFIVFKSLVTSNIEFTNLNEKYGIGGIQSDPTLTFLHPELSSRFTHNIGLTGKSQYDDWNDIKYEDPIFRNLAVVGALTKQQHKIRHLLRKKLKIVKQNEQHA